MGVLYSVTSDSNRNAQIGNDQCTMLPNLPSSSPSYAFTIHSFRTHSTYTRIVIKKLSTHRQFILIHSLPLPSLELEQIVHVMYARSSGYEREWREIYTQEMIRYRFITFTNFILSSSKGEAFSPWKRRLQLQKEVIRQRASSRRLAET